MNDDQYSAFLAVIVPDIVGLIASRHNLDEIEATHRFYSSKLYEKLSIERLKLWHYSAETLFSLFNEECEKGTLTFPEEAA